MEFLTFFGEGSLPCKLFFFASSSLQSHRSAITAGHGGIVNEISILFKILFISST